MGNDNIALVTDGPPVWADRRVLISDARLGIALNSRDMVHVSGPVFANCPVL